MDSPNAQTPDVRANMPSQKNIRLIFFSKNLSMKEITIRDMLVPISTMASKNIYLYSVILS